MEKQITIDDLLAETLSEEEKMKEEIAYREHLMSLYGIDEKDIVRDKDECDRAKYDWEWFDRIASYLTAQKKIFAKTLKTNPHFYTLRKLWKVDSHFEDTVMYMRMVGYPEWFYGKKYNMFNVNDWKWWTMWEHINEPDGKWWTILINAKHIDKAGTCHYDYIADRYDDFFKADGAVRMRKDIVNMVNYQKGEKILDIGCGTGMFLDYVDVDKNDYIGIDISNGMLNQLYKKHGFVNTINCTFEDFYNPYKFDKVVALFGSFSYINGRYISKAVHYLNKGGTATLMFYAGGIHPSHYDKAGIDIPFNEFSLKYLDGWKVDRIGNYMVARYTKE